MPDPGIVTSWERLPYTISTERAHLDIDRIHAFLTRSYWAAGIPRAVVVKSLEHSLCFSLLCNEMQVGFARVVSDFATFAYLADVFVEEAHQGRGLSKWLMEVIVGHPDLQGLRRFLLATRDAHGLYAQYGFTPLAAPQRWMERHDPDVYRSA
jgi:GNAT superfamily N-acetyltransferase